MSAKNFPSTNPQSKVAQGIANPLSDFGLRASLHLTLEQEDSSMSAANFTSTELSEIGEPWMKGKENS
jgi:hypothetical protein